MKLTRRILSLLFALAVTSLDSYAQQAACRVEPFQGATLPQGAIARMQVAGSSSACSITNYGLPAERVNPADSGSITKKPMHGTAEFSAPRATYTPEPGYVGDDEFEYIAFARGVDKQFRLKVLVKVSVTAP